MDRRFRKHIEGLHAKVNDLLAKPGIVFGTLPRKVELPSSGVYLFTERGRHLYVGRSNSLHQRLRNHCRPSARHNQASFAFRLALRQCGIGAATYSKKSSRAVLAQKPHVKRAFAAAKARLRKCKIRFVEERDQVRQALLEIYAAMRLRTPYNDFKTH